MLLTGCTGFLGKVVLEKLMRCHSEVGRIILLIRPSGGQSAEARLADEVMASPIFERLRRERGSGWLQQTAQSKLVPVNGDLLADRLALSPADRETVCSTANYVLHCAASVEFDSSLDKAVKVNVLGTLRLLELARECTQLRAFVHVSTAYVNANLREPGASNVEEKVCTCMHVNCAAQLRSCCAYSCTLWTLILSALCGRCWQQTTSRCAP